MNQKITIIGMKNTINTDHRLDIRVLERLGEILELFRLSKSATIK